MDSYGTLIALVIVMAASVWLGARAQQAVRRGSFVTGYFLGNRGLGAWALALTATVQSGGTFMGFPSLVYTYGWIVALWIAGYMVVPITGFVVLGKRFAQLSRRTGAVTVPDLFRERFDSPPIALLASLCMMLFIFVTMVAQFKAGAIVMKLAWPESGFMDLSETAAVNVDWPFLVGLTIFSLTVVGYTMIGGFLASVWTDLFQSVLMVIGVVILFFLVVPCSSPEEMRRPTIEVIEQLAKTHPPETAARFAFGPGFPKDGREFLPIGLAFSFFFVWVFAGMGTPAGMVRLMACKSTGTMRRSVILLSVYNLFIYLPLVVICICAHAMLPDLAKSDEVIPRLAILSTKDINGGSLIAGLILSAPFGAVMASVSSFLVLIASGLVRDVYQRFLRPEATDAELRRATHVAMLLLGVLAFAANINPVQFLQSLVIMSGAALAATFVTPAVMAAYWRRATAAGALAAMLAGAGVVSGLYVCGWLQPHPAMIMIGEASPVAPYYLFDVHPIVWGMLASAIAGISVSLITSPPPRELVSKLFDVDPVLAAQDRPATVV